MANSGIVDVIKGVFALSDRYERKARFLPSAFVVLPVSVAVFAFVNAKATPLLSAALATATELLMIMLVAMVARHLGVSYEKRLFDGQLPTDKWLSSKSPKSKQQVDQWAEALLVLTGLDIRIGSPSERGKVVKDATAQARKRLRDNPASNHTQEYNEDYGQARNLAGLAPIWLAVALAGATVCYLMKAWVPLAVEVAFAVGAIVYLLVARQFVQWTAERYAESFLSTVVVVAQEQSKSETTM